MFSILIISSFFIFISGCKKSLTIDQKEQAISKNLNEALPPGTSVRDLVSYLDKNKIDHGQYDQKSHSLYSIIRDVGRSAFVIHDFQIIFQFDKKDKLINFTWKEALTGP